MELFMILLSVGIGFILSLMVAFVLMCYFVWSDPLREGGPLFFVKAKQNTIMYIMRGETFSGKFIFLSKDQHIDQSGDIVDYGREKENPNFFGMVWIGIPGIYTIYKRHQKWSEWESIEGGRKVRFRDELTPFLITKPFEYLMFVKEAEDKDDLPIDIYFTVILKPVNALRPIFGNDNAYEQVQTLCINQARLFVKSNKFSKIGSGNKNIPNIDNDDFSIKMLGLNYDIPGRSDSLGIADVLGYQIMDAKIYSVEISGHNKEKIVEATTKEYIANQEAKAKVISAEAERDSLKAIAEGKKAIFEVKENFYNKIAYLPGAMSVEKLEKVPNLTTYVEGDGENKSKIVLPLK